jgi:hypothetical protein
MFCVARLRQSHRAHFTQSKIPFSGITRRAAPRVSSLHNIPLIYDAVRFDTNVPHAASMFHVLLVAWGPFTAP